MATEEMTSPSGSDCGGELAGELTSPSDQESDHQARGRGRGGGRSSKPGADAHRPKAKALGSKPKAKALRSRPMAKDRLPWLHRTRPSTTMAELDGEATSESEETKRIQHATKRTKMWTSDECTSGSDDDGHAMGEADMEATSMPKTSGVFDYAEWLIGKLTDEQRRKLACSFSYLDLCAGLGTTLIAHEAIQRAMEKHGLRIDGRCNGLTEFSKDRREALGRRLDSLGFTAPIKKSNADLIDDSSDWLLADLLFMGIVCVDISPCTSTPKSLTDPEGSTGASWMEFLAYLDKLPLENRPKVLVLECVANLGNNRVIKGRTEKGTVLVVEALRERGYVGEWRKISATLFCLPQRRPRVWGLFIKVRGGIGPKAIHTASQNITAGMDIVRTGECAGHEPLETILARTPSTLAYKPPKAKSSRCAAEWKNNRHLAFQARSGLSDEDVAVGEAEFLEATKDVLLPRERGAMWLQLCRLRKLGRIPNWKNAFLVSDCGSSVGWLSIAHGMFPCVRPGNKYLILKHGEPRIARGPECLAVQGIGIQEANATNLLLEDDSLLRTLAGNAFSANICCAFFVAALLSL